MTTEAQLKVFVHKIEKHIPKRITDFYNNEDNRRLIATKYGASHCFLDPSRLKFTLVDPTTGKYNPFLISYSVFKALWNFHRPYTKLPKSYYRDILEKGIVLYHELNCQSLLEKKINLPPKFNIRELMK